MARTGSTPGFTDRDWTLACGTDVVRSVLGDESIANKLPALRPHAKELLQSGVIACGLFGFWNSDVQLHGYREVEDIGDLSTLI